MSASLATASRPQFPLRSGPLRPFSWVIAPCLALLPLALAGGAGAAAVTWETPQPIAGAADVSLEGEYFGSWAPFNGGANSSPVNGVTFQGFDTLGISRTNLDDGGNLFVTHTTPNANYNTLLGYGAYSNATSATITLNGTGGRALTPGRDYLVQFWVSDPRSEAAGRSQTISGSAALTYRTGSAGMGQYVIGRFKADAATQVFTLTASAKVQVNLLQVRDVTTFPTANIYTVIDSTKPVPVWDNSSTAIWSSAAAGPFNKTWTAAGRGTAVIGGTGGSTTYHEIRLGETVEAAGITVTSPLAVLENNAGGASLMLKSPAVIDTGTVGADAESSAIEIDPPVAGTAGLTKEGRGILVLSGLNTYSGPTTISAGTLQLSRDGNTDYPGDTTFRGTGTLLINTLGTLRWGAAKATFALSPGAVIRVSKGTLKGGSNGNEDWTANQSDLLVEAGATFRGTEANVRVARLLGSGTVKTGYRGSGYENFTFGVGSNSFFTFSGVIADDEGPGNIVKAGPGSQVLEGSNTYTGTTTVKSGSLTLMKPCLSDSATVTVDAGGGLFLRHNEVDTIGRLVLGGQAAAVGLWGNQDAVNAGKAQFASPRLEGSGVLRVTVWDDPDGPAYFSGAAGAFSTWSNTGNAVWGAASGGPYNRNWSSFPSQKAVFEGAGGGMQTTEALTVKSLFFSVPGYTLSGQPLTLADGGVIQLSGSGSAEIKNVIRGNGLTTLGGGELVLSGANTYSGTTRIGPTLILKRDEDTDYPGDTTFTGDFFPRLIKTGAGTIRWGAAKAIFALPRRAEINVQSGTFTGGSGGNEDWTANQSNLIVAMGAIFKGAEANVRVGGLKGAGTIKTGSLSAGYTGFTFGVADLGTSFDGVIADDEGPGNIVKTGVTGQTLAGLNTYTGTTTVEDGVLSLTQPTLPDKATVTIAAGAKLDLTHSAVDTIGGLVLDGQPAAAGRWGSQASVTAGKADFATPFITGSGVLLVPAGVPADGPAYFSGASGGPRPWSNTANANWGQASGGPYNRTWGSFPSGKAVFEGTAGEVQVTEPMTVKSMLFTVVDYSLSGARLTLTDECVVDTGAHFTSIGNEIGGSGLEKRGAGDLVLSGANSYSGPTRITAGGVAFSREQDTDYSGDTTITGTGRLFKNGAGTIRWGASKATFALSRGSIINVLKGTLKGGSHGNEDWTANQSDLYVAEGATFLGTEADVRVNALTGGGTIKTGYNGEGYDSFTFGVSNGGDTFSGVIADDEGTGNIVKTGNGTQVLGGLNTYTGTTSVLGGTLSLAQPTLPDSATVTIAAGAALRLTHSAEDTIGSLELGGQAAAKGRWGSQDSVSAGRADFASPLITGSGVLRVTIGETAASPYDQWAAARISAVKPGADASPAGDPDGDGAGNLAEFAFNADPLSGGGFPGGIVRLARLGGVPVLTLTLPLRSGAVFNAPGAGGGLVSTAMDGVIYRIEGSRKDLADWTLPVTEVTGPEAAAIQSSPPAQPAPDAGWTLRTFRVPGSAAQNPTGFLRARVTSP